MSAAPRLPTPRDVPRLRATRPPPAAEPTELEVEPRPRQPESANAVTQVIVREQQLPTWLPIGFGIVTGLSVLNSLALIFR